jgi:hypothetical protein
MVKFPGNKKLQGCYVSILFLNFTGVGRDYKFSAWLKFNTADYFEN